MTSAIKRVIVIVNTIGFVAYLVWLMQFTTGETMRSQDGILYYVPCLPFLFVYMLLAPPKPASKEHPVSYTHLDVYKRQAKATTKKVVKAAKKTAKKAVKKAKR